MAALLLKIPVLVGVLTLCQAANVASDAELIEKLKSGTTAERRSAARALGGLTPKSKEFLPVLLAALKDQAGFAVWKVNGPVEAAVPALITDEQYDGRINVPTMIELMKPDPVLVVPAYIALITDRDASMRANVCNGLGSYREQARVAVPALLGCLNDKNSLVRGNAAIALGHIGDKQAAVVQGVRRLLKDEDALARVQAAAACWRLERRAQDILPLVMKEAAASEGSLGQFTAIRVLGEIGPGAKAAVPLLQEHLKKQTDLPADKRSKLGNSWQRALLIEALGRIGDAQDTRNGCLGGRAHLTQSFKAVVFGSANASRSTGMASSGLRSRRFLAVSVAPSRTRMSLSAFRRHWPCGGYRPLARAMTNMFEEGRPGRSRKSLREPTPLLTDAHGSRAGEPPAYGRIMIDGVAPYRSSVLQPQFSQ